QYDVSDPFHPKKTGSIHIGGIVRHASHPRQPKAALNGGPQMVELSRDGRRIYFTNSLYSPWDAQFYPEGIRSWMVKVNASPSGGDLLRARPRNCSRGADCRTGSDCCACELYPYRRGRFTIGAGNLAHRSKPAFQMGRDAGGFPRTHHLVVSDGLRAWSGPDG